MRLATAVTYLKDNQYLIRKHNPYRKVVVGAATGVLYLREKGQHSVLIVGVHDLVADDWEIHTLENGQ